MEGEMIKPLPGYVLVEPLDDEDKTSTGFLLPEKSKEKPAKGKVIATSERKLEYPNSEGMVTTTIYDAPVRIDEIVVFHRWAGQDVKDGDKEYKLVKFGDLMGVYE